MPQIRPSETGHQCHTACGTSSQSLEPSKRTNGDTQISQRVAMTNPQRQALAMQHVQTINQESLSDQLTSILHGLQPVNTAKNELYGQCCPPSTHGKSTFTMAQNTPRSALLLLNSIKAVIERLTQNSSDTSERILQKQKELLERLGDKLGVSNKENLLFHLSHEWTENPAFLMTFDSIVKDPQNAEALGIEGMFYFNTANTGKEALADPKTKTDFEILLNKLGHIPVYGIKQHAAKALVNLPDIKNYGNLKSFLANYTLPADKLLKNASTLLGALSFKSSEKEYSCLIVMNSSTKRLGYQKLSDHAAAENPELHPTYQNSKSYTAYLNFTSNSTDQADSSGEKLQYKAGAQAIIFNPPKKTKVTKDAFLDWILGASSPNENNKSHTPHLIHICAADLINFGMIETEEVKHPTRVVPRTGTGVPSKHSEPIVVSSDKENLVPGGSNPQNANNDINHRVYDTEHMMLTLAHELSKHIANKDRVDNKMDISLLSSYKACISCTRAITTLPFNDNFKNMSRFFYVDTTAHDYRIEY